MNLAHPVTPSVLAFLTTLHLALAVLRGHRTAGGPLLYFVSGISFLFASSPWLMPTPAGLAFGFVAHLAWFLACEGSGVAQQPAISATTDRTRHVVSTQPSVSSSARGIAHAARNHHDPFVMAPVMTVLDETPDVRTFRIGRPDGFTFKAGQFLTVRLRANGKEHVRCYSISSAPEAQGYLEISVKRLGLVSSALHASIRPGAMLAVRSPGGSFVYPTDDERPLVLLAGGVGITPLMSMLRHASVAEPTRPVTLFYSLRRVEDIAFSDELTLLARRSEHIRVFIAVSDGPPGPGHFPGHISESLVTTMVPDLLHAVCLICGPQPMMDAMTAMLSGVGVAKPQIRFEAFQAAVAASTRVGASVPVAAGPAEPEGVRYLTFQRSGQRSPVDSSHSLLEAAERCGADIPSLCRAGVCGTCRTRVVSGETECTSSMLDERDKAAGYVLACVTHILSDCTVDA
jgi:ferredoxin-NADP reductase